MAAHSLRSSALPVLLYVTVSITGAAVMILELLGTRIIAPFYGVSLYVWSSLIAVTLIALAAGYFLGGYLADRAPSVKLAHVIAFAALTTLAIPFCSGPILRLTNPMGLRLGAFTSAFLLFTPPLTALAMVGPYAIKQAAHDLRGIGTLAGSVYAVSTIGSVAGTLLLGFFLLPEFGTRSIVFALSLALGALAVLAAWHTRATATPLRSIWPLLALATFVGTGAGAGLTLAREPVPGFIVQSEAESLYGWVRVIDDTKQGHRILFSDASVLSAVDLASDRSLLGYQQVLEVLPALLSHPSRALLIGLGGGHVARNLKARGIATDTIEIDPAVAEAARRWFHFEPTGQFLVGDARYEISRLKGGYDLVIHDCFTGGAEPTHLLTREMLGELRGLLNEGGVLALNYVGFTTGEGADAAAAVARTVASLFPSVRVFVTDKGDFTDFIFLASSEPLSLDALRDDDRRRWLLDHEHRFADRTGFVITDDYNPMERRQLRKAETYRRHFLDRIAFELLIR